MKKIVILLFLSLFFLVPSLSFAQNLQPETLEVKVLQIESQNEQEQVLRAIVEKGSLTGKSLQLTNAIGQTAQSQIFKTGDRLLVEYTKDEFGENFYISDVVRRDSLTALWVLFCVVVLAIAGIWGITSIVGMAYSFFVIFAFILPQILAGHNPVIIAVIGAVAIIPVTFYISHGFSKKTSSAVLGTLIALVVTGLLAGFFIDAAMLTGFSSEEAGFLYNSGGGVVHIKGLLLAGIIIGALGALDDVTVSQASIVTEIAHVSKKLTLWQLYSKAMRVGKDHISSAVNTLVLVYTGASLPLLLLFINNATHPFSEVINYEIVAEEIIRTLVGSIGLIIAVPITTFIAAVWIQTHHEK